MRLNISIYHFLLLLILTLILYSIVMEIKLLDEPLYTIWQRGNMFVLGQVYISIMCQILMI